MLQEPHGVTSQKTPFFIVTAVKTSSLTPLWLSHFSLHWPEHSSDMPVSLITQAILISLRGVQPYLHLQKRTQQMFSIWAVMTHQTATVFAVSSSLRLSLISSCFMSVLHFVILHVFLWQGYSISNERQWFWFLFCGYVVRIMAWSLILLKSRRKAEGLSDGRA
jgi:hypothetical protein